LGLHLAYIETGNARIDDLSHAALTGLVKALGERTTIEASGVRAVVPGQDDLVYYPFLYFPVRRDAVLTKSFYLTQVFPGRWANGTVWVDKNRNGASQDGVSSVIIGSQDWAAGWAIDTDGIPIIDIENDIARQREMSIRFGVNLTMYALAGNYPDIAFDPLLPTLWITILGVLAILAACIGAVGRLHTFISRLLAALAIILALLNPQTVIEDREPLNDIVLVLRDQSESAKIGTRQAQSDKAYRTLIDALDAQDRLDIVNAVIPTGTEGTRLTTALIEAMGDIPPSRFAGVIALTDGQVHDLPAQAERLLPENTPFHALIVGDPDIRDRRIRAVLAPKYGLVGEQAVFQVQVDDPGHEGELLKSNVAAQIRSNLLFKRPMKN